MLSGSKTAGLFAEQRMKGIEAKNLTVFYEQVPALIDVDIRIGVSQFAVILGPNGAGKSTLLKALSGMLFLYGGRIKNGRVLINDQDITNVPINKLVRQKISYVPDERNLFSTLSVEENLLLSSTVAEPTQDASTALQGVYNLLPFLRERRRQKAGTLSGGEQRMVAIARALVQNPDFLLLDEPTMDLSRDNQEFVLDKLKDMNLNRRITIVMAEQNRELACAVATMVVELSLQRIKRIAYQRANENTGV